MCTGTHSFVVLINTLMFVVHGFIGVFFGGFWIAQLMTLQVLFQEDDINNSTEGNTATRAFLAHLLMEPLEHIVTGGIEIYQAFLLCCALLCKLKTIMRLLCLVSVLLVAHNISYIIGQKQIQSFNSDQEMAKKVFLDNFLRLYDSKNGTRAVSTFTFEMDGAQVFYRCCGVNDYLDYANASLWKSGSGRDLTVPHTCCRLSTEAYLFFSYFIFEQGYSCAYDPTPLNSYRHQGCHDSIFATIETRKFWYSLVWDILSSVLNFFTLFLLGYTIQRSKKVTVDDHMKGMRDIFFVHDPKTFVRQKDDNEEKMPSASAEKEKTANGKGLLEILPSASGVKEESSVDTVLPLASEAKVEEAKEKRVENVLPLASGAKEEAANERGEEEMSKVRLAKDKPETGTVVLEKVEAERGNLNLLDSVSEKAEALRVYSR